MTSPPPLPPLQFPDLHSTPSPVHLFDCEEAAKALIDQAIRDRLFSIVVLGVGDCTFGLLRKQQDDDLPSGWLSRRGKRKPVLYRLTADNLEKRSTKKNEEWTIVTPYTKIISVGSFVAKKSFSSSNNAANRWLTEAGHLAGNLAGNLKPKILRSNSTSTSTPTSSSAPNNNNSSIVARTRSPSTNTQTLQQDKEEYQFFLRIVTLRHGEERTLDLFPTDSLEHTRVVQWICALQYRTQLYDLELERAKERADKARRVANIVSTATLSDVVRKPTQETFGITRRITNLFITPPPPPLPPLEQARSYRRASSLSSMRLSPPSASNRSPPQDNTGGGVSNRLFARFLWGGSGTNTGSTSAPNTPTATSPTTAIRIASTIDHDPPISPPTKPCTIEEDEMWENQRWQNGWSASNLLPTDRQPFSDRCGIGNWAGGPQSMPVPSGWVLVHPWTIDLREATDNLCSAEGWCYQASWSQLDSDYASGQVQTFPSARWLVRRRKWYRVRDVCDSSPSLHDDSAYLVPKDVVHGWLGISGVTSGVWASHYCFLLPVGCKSPTGGGPTNGTNLSQYQSFAVFKKGKRSHRQDGLLICGWNDPAGFVSKAHLKVKYLDDGCKVHDDVRIRSCELPGLFSLHLSGEEKPRLLNAGSAAEKKRWVHALLLAIESSPPPTFDVLEDRRSIRKAVAWEFSRIKRVSGKAMDESSKRIMPVLKGTKNGIQAALMLTRTSLPGGSSLGTTSPTAASSHFGFGGGNGNGNDGGDGDDFPMGMKRVEMKRVESEPDLKVITELRQEYRQRESSRDLTGDEGSPPLRGGDGAAAVTRKRPSPIASPTMMMDDATTLIEPESDSPTGGGGALDSGADEPSAAHPLPKHKKSLVSIGGGLLKRAADRTTSVFVGGGKQANNQQHHFAPDTPNIITTTTTTTTTTGATSCDSNGGGGVFSPPENYENILFDGIIDVCAETLDRTMFAENEFTYALFAFENITDAILSEWTKAREAGSEQRRSYRMPRAGIVPPGPAYHLISRFATVDGMGYVVDQVVDTPEMPFGTCFSTDLRNIITQEKDGRCRIIVSQKVTMRKSMMAASWAKSSIKKEMTTYYNKKWAPFLVKWLTENRSSLLVAGDSRSKPHNTMQTTSDGTMNRQQSSEDLGNANGRGSFMTWSRILIIVVLCFIALMCMLVGSLMMQINALSLREKELERRMEEMLAVQGVGRAV